MQAAAVALFFNALQPFTVSFIYFCAPVELDPDIGGCCGEITVDRAQLSLANPVVMAQVRVTVYDICAFCSHFHFAVVQHFEYTMAK